jgi:cytochrome c5
MLELQRDWARSETYAPVMHIAKEHAGGYGKGSAGLDMLMKHAIDGFGAMPAQGGCAELTAAQIRDAIVFMRAAAVAAPVAPAGTTR